MRALLIVNPLAGKGRGVADSQRALTSAGIDFDLAVTAHRGNATELAAQARLDGRDLVIAAGGDGTVHEVVNGLLSDGGGRSPALGMLPVGSGCDYARTFEIPTDLMAAAQVIASGHDSLVDVGEAMVTTDHGQRRRIFVNIAEAGVGAEVVHRASRLPRFLGPAMYFTAFWTALPGFKPPAVTSDSSTWPAVMNVVVAVGKVFGGGMRIAPEADPRDGLFDVQFHHGTKLDYVLGIAKVYRGTHLPHPRIVERRLSELSVESQTPMMVEADGEVLGTTPASFRVLAGALRLRL